MALKRAKFYTYGEDTLCEEIKKYIEEAGIVLDVRDLAKDPFTRDELTKLIGFLDIKHFLNTTAKEYKTHNLDKQLPEREELIKILSEEPSLVRRPIIQNTRLITVGCDRRKISEMLQLSMNGSNMSMEDSKGNIRNNNRRSDSGRSREAVGGK